MKFKLLLLLLFFVLSGTVTSQTLKECQDVLEQGKSLISNGQYAEALEFLTKAQVLAEQYNWHEENFVANNCMGIVYSSFVDYGEALEYYLRAYNIAMSHLGEDKEIAVMNNIGAIYFYEENYDKALYFHEKAYKVAKRLNNKEKIAVFATNMGNFYNKLQEADKASEYIAEAFAVVENYPVLLLRNKINFAENFLLRDKKEDAIAVLNEILSESSRLENREIYQEALTDMSKAYFPADPFKAVDYAEQGLYNNKDHRSKLALYDLLAQYYFQIEKYHLSMSYKDSVVALTDSISIIKNSRLFENNKIKFDLQNYKDELKQKQERISFERTLFVVSIGVILLIMFLIYSLFRNKLEKEKQRKIIAEREQDIIALELEKEKNEHLLLERHLENVEKDAILEQEKLKNEIEHKNRKLSAKALYFSGRNQMIEDVIQSLNKLPAIHNSKMLKNQLNSLQEHLRTDTEWNSFIAHFEEVNQGFLSGLKTKHPELNANDIRFVCYVFMNLSTKEICSVFNITPEACRKRKARIAKKLGVPQGDTLYNYLSELTQNI